MKSGWYNKTLGRVVQEKLNVITLIAHSFHSHAVSINEPPPTKTHTANHTGKMPSGAFVTQITTTSCL